MQLVPIPTTPDYLTATRPYWEPFLPDIARRSSWSEAELVRKLFSHEVQAVLGIDDQRRAVALLGVSICEDDDGARVGVLVWLTGKQRNRWQHLLADLELYLRAHVRCAKCRAICRAGWRAFLEQHGYTLIRTQADKHIVMEKVFHG